MPRARRIVRWVNGLLRGHPHDWPEERGDGRSILDFGCFDGQKLAYWYQRGWHVAGIDLNQKAIDAARRRFPNGRFWCGDLLELRIDDRFDVVRSDNVFEHLLDPMAYLTALRALLRPQGRIYLYVPNGRALSVRLFGRCSYVYWMPFHLNLFTRKTLRLALERSGFTGVCCFTFSPIGSWTFTQRQALLRPGFAHGSPSRLDRLLQRFSLLNYPGEVISQWFGMGEEIVATAAIPDE
jgi:SAM-dependent methyltransferase